MQVINAYNGTQVNYGPDAAEFEGTLAACHEYIAETLDKQREQPGMQNTGTFLRVYDPQVGEWLA